MQGIRRWGARVALAWLIGVGGMSTAGAADDALYQALGGEAGIARIVDGMLTRAYADDRIKKKFDGVKPQALNESIRKQFCQLSGGPCVYDGETMAKSLSPDITAVLAAPALLLKVKPLGSPSSKPAVGTIGSGSTSPSATCSPLAIPARIGCSRRNRCLA